MSLRTRWLPLTVLVVAVLALVLSIVWMGAFDHDRDGYRHRGFMSPVASDVGPVSDLDAARAAAENFGDRWGFGVGEVMQFENNYYAVLVDDGSAVTEVLVDPTTGVTHFEWGPAMMWNTAFGMHQRRMHRFSDDGFDNADRRCDLTADESIARADEWLRDKGTDETSSEPLQFPGYYTLHTERAGQVVGMLSVRCTNDDVWYHTWHGDFVAMSDT